MLEVKLSSRKADKDLKSQNKSQLISHPVRLQQQQESMRLVAQ